MHLPDKWFDVLKKIAQFVLPGAATLYFAVSQIWGLPYTEEVVGSIVAFNVFLGALLGISDMQYKHQQNVLGANVGNGPDEVVPVKNPWNLPENVYELLKWVSLFFLPAVGTLYFTLAKLWGWMYGPELLGTIASITAFLGLVLGISTKKHNEGL